MLEIRNGSVLAEGKWGRENVTVRNGVITGNRDACKARRLLDAAGLLVLPGIVDMHGDAFERQIMPRPGVSFDLETALLETDRQLIANGVTTAFHGVTCSWEPGLRSLDATRALLDANRKLQGRFIADTRIHLRHEIFNLGCEADVIGWMKDGFIHALAFNDHIRGLVNAMDRRGEKIDVMVERSGLDFEAFQALVRSVISREADVTPSVASLAAAARSFAIPLLSHDDRSVGDRETYRALGCRISEFPMSLETAASALERLEDTVFGAPNVLRGGSHIGCPAAADMVARGLCTILASDYYYPALLEAPFQLARDGVASLSTAWSLVSTNPARAMGLSDRGAIREGLRGDLLLVDNSTKRPRLVATIVGGEIAWLSEFTRLQAPLAA